ncbi:MAG: hypothetical protein EZS28_030686 [Streblomastix strix]|uniref:Uncharacterized protein n=1 Tax=Streblomastix strix TaxID=222440 RepID=A0A5J4UUD6_9EUKA|nr:MAG: hypothetical protein EZS28_030686 [Streblomastix strix]
MLGLEFKMEGVYPCTANGDAKYDVKMAQFAVWIQKACVAASTALIQGDIPANQRFILICHHVAQMIIGDASSRLDEKIVADEFKPLIGKKGSILNAQTLTGRTYQCRKD